MQLKEDINYSDFWNAVHRCSADVYFETDEGDRLNLKSTLSQFIFTAITASENHVFTGRIRCCQEDLQLLQPFCKT